MFETELKLNLDMKTYSSFIQYLSRFEKLYDELYSTKDYSSSINLLCLDTLRIESKIQNLIQEMTITQSKTSTIQILLKKLIGSIDRNTIIRSITPITFLVIQFMLFLYNRFYSLNILLLIFNIIYSASLIHFYLHNDKVNYDPDPIELMIDWITNIFFTRINSIATSLDPFLKRSMENVVWYKPFSYIGALIYISTILLVSYFSFNHFIQFIHSFFIIGQRVNNREQPTRQNIIHNTYNIHLNHTNHDANNQRRIDYNNNEDEEVYLSANESETDN